MNLKSTFVTAFLLFVSLSYLIAQPNFVLIISDDMGWNGTNVAMSQTESGSKSGFYFTPNLDNLMAKKDKFIQSGKVVDIF